MYAWLKKESNPIEQESKETCWIPIQTVDRRSEFKNKLIDEALEAFDIKRSLSAKGTPYDNAVAEAMFKTIKTEFVNGAVFSSQQELDLGLFDYVNWFNHIRIHESLGYLTPSEYKRKHEAEMCTI